MNERGNMRRTTSLMAGSTLLKDFLRGIEQDFIVFIRYYKLKFWNHQSKLDWFILIYNFYKNLKSRSAVGNQFYKI